MERKKFKSLLISDFNINVLNGYLSNDDSSPEVITTVAPFGQVVPVLIGKDLACWKSNPDFLIVWTQAQSLIKSFKDFFDYKAVAVDKILSEVDDYTHLLLGLQDRTNFILVPTWVFPTYHRGYGILEMKRGNGIINMLMRMNLRLADNLDKSRNIYLLNTQKWIEAAGKSAFNPKLWYMAKLPFGNIVFKEAARDIKSALRALTGDSKKIVIVDLDDTLWGGIAGDIGWRNIVLGGHDPIGEAFVDFQKALKSLANRGILLGIVSKNEESVALEAINNHPEMVLKLSDFVGWRINWEDKAKNIVDLTSELNLGLESVVFIDDSPVDRARVKETLPEVLVPAWPEESMLYCQALLNLACFDTPSISEEDLKRTKMYAAEGYRRTMKPNIGSLDEWLKTLCIKVEVEELNEVNLSRATQLLNKTNQMNLTTRRLTEKELRDWASEDGHNLWTFRISDKFGDSGLTGIISLKINTNVGQIVDFILSCRVFGRRIEEVMVYTVISYAKSLKLQEVFAKYVPTSKNKPCLRFWEGSGFQYNRKDNSFSWKVNKKYSAPKGIEIRGNLWE